MTQNKKTYILLGGIGLGYGFLILTAGFRPIVLLSGGAIAFTGVYFWLKKEKTQDIISDNLLEKESLQAELSTLKARIFPVSQTIWNLTENLAIQSHEFSFKIANLQPSLIPELLETQHTVLDLCWKIADILQAIEQMQTPAYRNKAQKLLEASCDRLQVTKEQLQHFHDQLCFENIDIEMTAEILPSRLNLLIDDNKTTIQHTLTL